MKIIIVKSAKKSLKKMDKKTRDRILEAIQKIPLGDIKKLQGLETDYRLRVGNYRVLYSQKSDMIEIYAVLPRGEAYKRL